MSEGVIFATFDFEGNTPSCMYLLKMLDSAAYMHSDDILINLMRFFQCQLPFFHLSTLFHDILHAQSMDHKKRTN